MRVFYAADSTPNPDFSSGLWRANLHDSLVALGHEVIEFRYDLATTFRHLDPARSENAAYIAENRPRLGRALLEQIRAAHAAAPIHVFFSYFYDACVEPAVIDAIRALGIVTVNWFCNASYQLHLVSQIAPHYDWCLVPERFRLDEYRALGARPIYCQEAANPQIYKPCEVALEFDVAFAGQCYADRPDIVLWLREQGIDVRVWGARWEYHVVPPPRNPLRRWLPKPRGLPAGAVGGVLDDPSLVELYSRARINLGFAAVGESREEPRLTQVRLRDFEVPMSGGFYLAEHSDELADFFTPGVEIETWRTRKELLEKCRYYLAHDDARRAIAAAGRARALREHTWEHRFTAAFHAMGLA
ncbi:MAG: glycosyltransferase [Chthoniobacter sp.]|nr:glycosyltransferase [Chthoniobacter sp.]